MDVLAEPTAASSLTEEEFAGLVDTLADSMGGDALTALLHEEHAVYDQRGTSAIVRMRGWVLLALARVGVPPDALPFVLDELDAGADGYLVAAAARALRSYPSPRAEFAPFILQAIGNVRYRDDAVAFDSYGAYPTTSRATTPMRELLATLQWLGPHGREALPQLEALRTPGSGISRKLLPDIDRAITSLRLESSAAAPPDGCCSWRTRPGVLSIWPFGTRVDNETVRAVRFEDQDGVAIDFAGFFLGQPSIVAFFYTRCDNPNKCSLTVSKLARVQEQLAERGVADRVRTAAITYDPGFDLPARLRGYGQDRRLRMDDGHRLLRAIDGVEPLRRYFGLGVNFVESLVNRHRIEIYVLDGTGRIAASFVRLRWNEQEVVERAVALLQEVPEATPSAEVVADARPAVALDAGALAPASRATVERAAWPVASTVASLGFALFPKCPICWATYMSALGIARLTYVPYSPWMQPALFAVVLVNLASVWRRGRSTRRMTGFYLASAGAMAVVATQFDLAAPQAALFGVALTLAGSVVSAWSAAEAVRLSRGAGRRWRWRVV